MGSGALKYFGCHHCQVRAVSNVMKVVLVGSFWATTFACYYLLRREQESDPSFSLFDDDENRFAIATGVIITLYSVYLLWLLALTCDACRAPRELTTPFRFVALITMAQAIVVIVGPFVGACTIPKSSARSPCSSAASTSTCTLAFPTCRCSTALRSTRTTTTTTRTACSR